MNIVQLPAHIISGQSWVKMEFWKISDGFDRA